LFGGAERRAHPCERGSAVVELALVLPFVTVLVLGTVDLGRVFRLQNRLVNSAREGGMFAQFRPLNVNSGCEGGQNIVDRAVGEDAGLAALPAFRIEVLKKDVGTGSLTPYVGCRTTPSVGVAPGDSVVVRVSAGFSPLTPVVSALVGSTITLTGSQEVVVQG
jgi:hypothetical protein